jgi:geranylgeranyl pyrophosphate synthase
VLREGKYDSVQQQDLHEALQRTGRPSTRTRPANEYAEQACAALEILPESDYCDSLRALATYILDRDR